MGTVGDDSNRVGPELTRIETSGHQTIDASSYVRAAFRLSGT